LTDELDEILEGDKFRRIAREIGEGVASCRRTCAYFDVCSASFPAEKYCENGTFRSTETVQCAITRKAVADVVLSYLERHSRLENPQVGGYPAPTRCGR
jgi:uncharacterized protein